jgi:hypothetical protein
VWLDTTVGIGRREVLEDAQVAESTAPRTTTD